MARNNAATVKRKGLFHTCLYKFVTKTSGKKNRFIYISLHPNRRAFERPLGHDQIVFTQGPECLHCYPILTDWLHIAGQGVNKAVFYVSSNPAEKISVDPCSIIGPIDALADRI